MKNKMRTRIIIIAISAPIIVALLMEFNFIWKVETDNDWIGFYASYIGSIIGVYGVFEVMRIDHIKREEERKDELFLNILPIYRKISLLIKVEKLYKLKEIFTEIRNEDNWIRVDSSTKIRLSQIERNLDFSDESGGLFYAIRDFINSKLYNELKVTTFSSGNEFSESVEYEDVPNEILDELTKIVLVNSTIELEYEDIIDINVSKDELLEKFEKNSYTKGYREKIDIIYTKLLQINESKEWSDYISKRSAVFKEISDLSNQIINRIEKVLNF